MTAKQEAEAVAMGLLAATGRIRKLIPIYESVGSVSTFIVSMMRQLVLRTESAMRVNDIAAMEASFKELSRFENSCGDRPLLSQGSFRGMFTRG